MAWRRIARHRRAKRPARSPAAHDAPRFSPSAHDAACVSPFALDATDGTILYCGDTVNNSSLFVRLLERLDEHYTQARVIHVILDNYGIHHSAETRAALRRLPRIRLHFLPPYCPDENRIERLWEDLHAAVTRNHRHDNLVDLCQDVIAWLDARCEANRSGVPLLPLAA